MQKNPKINPDDKTNLIKVLKEQIKYYQKNNAEYGKKFKALGIQESDIPTNLNCVSTLLELQNKLDVTHASVECLTAAYINKFEKENDLNQIKMLNIKYNNLNKKIEEKPKILEMELNGMKRVMKKMSNTEHEIETLTKKVNKTKKELLKFEDKNSSMNITKLDIINVHEKILEVQKLETEFKSLQNNTL